MAMLPKQEAKIAVNSSPNLFRLSLPEWLKEQVDSGKHKGVYWINEKERIFHVPWKHASRNGWEDDDVSLFRAWAIYTNRYRIGVDKPRPALWKTNFRCAINSHNSISFLKDQGQRKGDKAHRIMKIVDPPKKNRTRLLSPDASVESPRKLVRLTYPNFGQSPDSVSRLLQTTPRRQVEVVVSSFNTGSSYVPSKGSNACDSCNELKGRLHFILENAFKGQENLENNTEYIALKSKYLECITTTKEHVCSDKPLTDLINNIIPSSTPFIPSQDIKPKPNLQDLYYVGKALQLSSADNVSTMTTTETTVSATVEIKTEGMVIEVLESNIDDNTITQDIEVLTESDCDTQEEANDDDTKGGESEGEEKEEDSFFDGKDAEKAEISEEEDDLITPRDT